ncbi:MAG: DUF983 domain-containing protein [Gemmatimonadota bacterium]
MQSWFRATHHCAACGFRFDRSESGYEVGSLAVNTSLTLVLLVAGILASVTLGWPTPNWQAITIAMVLAALALPVVIFPWSKALYLALDVSFRPPAPGDFTATPPA